MKQKWMSLGNIVAGCALTAAAFGLVVLPQQFTAGGITGLSVMLCQVVPVNVSVMVLGVNLLLFALGWFFVSREFVLKTLLVNLLFPGMLELFQRVTVLEELAADPLLSSVLAGGMLGLGTGMILRGDGSCGGFDILGVILHKKFHIPVSLVMYVCDVCVILTQAVAKPPLKTAYGILVILVTSLTVNRVLTHGKAEGQMMIFSQNYEAIRRELLNHQDVGMTFLEGESGYLREPMKVIVTVMPHSKIESVKQAVQRIDPTAFVLMDTVRYVGGRGYTISRQA